MLDAVSLVCANFGNGSNLQSVLEDWVSFIGGKPAEVLFVDGGSDATTQAKYLELFNEGLIDKLQVIRPTHADNHKDKCVIQEYYAGAQASNPYILFFKIDTLPFRIGHDDWLEKAVAYLDRPDVFSVGGSFNYDSRHHEAWPNWYFSHKCSLNFALMKREKYMAALDEFAREYILSGFTTGNPLEGKPDARFVIERAFEVYMERHNEFTLAREEDETWTVAHTNLKDEDLRAARDNFYKRRGVSSYIERQRATKEPHAVYYGMRTPLVKRLRIAFGKSFLGPTWRAIKTPLVRMASR